MKRFLALVLAALMVCTVSSFTAFAEDAVLTFSDARIDGDNVEVDVILSAMPEGVEGFSAIDMSYDFSENLTYVSTTSVAFTGVTANTGALMWYSTADVAPGADLVLFTIKFTKSSDANAELAITDFMFEGNNGDYCVFMGDGGVVAVDKTIALSSGPAKTTIDGATNDVATGNTLADGSVTDVQVGTGIGVKFAQPAGMAGASSIEVKWSVHNGTKRVYSAAATDITEAISGIAAGSNVTLAATFLNGTHTAGVNNSDVVTVSAPGAIFKAVKDDATAYFFTNAADNN